MGAEGTVASRALPHLVARANKRVTNRFIERVEVVGRSAAWPALPRLVRIVIRLLRVRKFAVLHTRDGLVGEP